MKTEGIPLWVTLVLAVTVLLGVGVGGMAMLGAGMDASQSVSWGGRNLGLGLVALAAILLKSPAAYIAAFFGGIGRETGDIIDSLSAETPNMPILILAAVMLVVWVIGLNYAFKALRS